MSDDEIIAVVQAHKEGNKIQRRLADLPMDGPSMEWIDAIHPCWDFDHYEYRVTPEQRKPREWTLYFYNGVLTHICPTTLNYETIHVREVIEEDNKSTIERMMEYASGFKND